MHAGRRAGARRVGGGGRGDVLDIMHDRSRMSVDSRIPLRGVTVFHPAQMIYDSIASCDRPPKNKQKTVPWLPSSGSERHVLKCRCQPTPTQPIYNVWGGARRGVYSISYMAVAVTIGPRIPIAPGRSTPGFRGPDRHRLHQARSAVKTLGESLQG